MRKQAEPRTWREGRIQAENVGTKKQCLSGNGCGYGYFEVTEKLLTKAK
jgi:hypothetical protein